MAGSTESHRGKSKLETHQALALRETVGKVSCQGQGIGGGSLG